MEPDVPDGQKSLTSVVELELTCPICYRFCRPPIVQCCNGHNICHACRPKVDRCGLCNGSLTDVRNLFAEKVSEFLRVSCRHQHNGCKEVLNKQQIVQHESKCSFVTRCHFVVNCALTENNPCGFISLCNWHGKNMLSLLDHVHEQHSEGLLRTNPAVCEIDLNGLSCQSFLQIAHHQIFWIFFSKCKNSLHGTVEGITWPNGKVLHFEYWFELRSRDRTESIVRRGTVLPCRRQNKVLNFYTSGIYTLLVEGQEMRKFVHKNQIYVKIYIERNTPFRSAVSRRSNILCKR